MHTLIDAALAILVPGSTKVVDNCMSHRIPMVGGDWSMRTGTVCDPAWDGGRLVVVWHHNGRTTKISPNRLRPAGSKTGYSLYA